MCYLYAPEVKEKYCHYHDAGGPAVMLTDTLSNNGLEVPHIEGEAAERLKATLRRVVRCQSYRLLATGTAEQLGFIIDDAKMISTILTQ